mmetsp:Transcript_5912/g.14131  ORF Transcript_5912/g.14131 Transcript_5912/m.14131 type:complete len:590 (+) Transcript_5912:105-1874(+)
MGWMMSNNHSPNGEDGEDAESEVKKRLFAPINNLRHGDADQQEIENARYNDTWCGKLAKDKRFEVLTMFVITLNALVIGYDADYTARYVRADWLYEDEPQFIFFELFFAVYFSVELFIRFFGLKRKLDCIEKWFVFDSILVTMMVIETFIIESIVKAVNRDDGGAGISGASVLRLLRLLRITRMSRLMRSFPELMTIIRGLAASIRSVFWTGVILFLLTYTWAILFTNEYHQGQDDDLNIRECAFNYDSGNFTLAEDKTIHDCIVQVFFGSMGKSMASLLVMGAVLDDVTACSDSIRKSGSPHYIVFFVLYIIFASFTLLNMLTGILCEVVNASAESEKIKTSEAKLRDAIESIVNELDKNSDGKISRNEFKKMQKNRKILKALKELQIERTEIEKYYEYLFAPREDGQEPNVTIDEMTQMIMRTRPGTPVGALDMAAVKQVVITSYTQAQRCIQQILDMVGENSATAAERAATPQTPTLPGQVTPQTNRDSRLPPSVPHLPTQQQAVRTISVDTMDKLEHTMSADIIRELQRRLGMADLEKTGVPLIMMDKELQEQVKAQESFATLGVPQSEVERQMNIGQTPALSSD